MARPKVPVGKVFRIITKVVRVIPEVIEAIDEADDPDSPGGKKITAEEALNIATIVGEAVAEVVIGELRPRRRRKPSA